jgi:type I restriction enzyme S subunit
MLYIDLLIPKQIPLSIIWHCSNIFKLESLSLNYFSPLSEQKRIVKILSTWDKAISVTEKLLTNSQQQKKPDAAIAGKKRLLDENGVRFSGEWCTCFV